VRCGLLGEGPVLHGAAPQRRLDIARARIVALDQVRVVGVHDPHESSQFAHAVGMKGSPDLGGLGADGDDKVAERLGDHLLDAASELRSLPIPTIAHHIDILAILSIRKAILPIFVADPAAGS
jgi:hypothetical protein